MERKPYGEHTSFTEPGPPLSEQAVWRRHNPKYSINTTLISSKSVCVCAGGGHQRDTSECEGEETTIGDSKKWELSM